MRRLSTSLVFLVLCLCACGSGEPEPKSDPQKAAAKISEVAMQAHFARIEAAAREYQALKGSYPTDVSALVEEGLLSGQAATDPWGNPWALETTGGELVVVSYGADGVPGGTDEDRDRRSR